MIINVILDSNPLQIELTSPVYNFAIETVHPLSFDVEPPSGLNFSIGGTQLNFDLNVPQIVLPVTAVFRQIISSVWGETPAGAIDGVNRTYTTTNPYIALGVYLNGLRLRHSDDYVETGNQSFQLLNAPLSGDSLSIDYIQP
jgi:hypothetical protein